MNQTLALIRALAFLQSRSLVNGLKQRLRRLKQPKYLIGAVVGAGYMYMWFGRALLHTFRQTPRGMEIPGEAFSLMESFAVLAVFVLLVGTWIFSGDRASLRLSEAELNFLLPAPLTRKMLVRFRLIRAQIGTLLSALFLTLFTGRFARDGHAFIHVLSWWLILTVLNLHSIGASFTIQRLSEAGLSSWLRRLLALAVGLGIAGSILWWLRSLPAPTMDGIDGPKAAAREFNEWMNLATNQGPAPWLLAPCRWLVKPWFAADWWTFLRALPPVLGVILLHYWWIERSDVSFEEATLIAARKRADLRAAAKKGGVRARPLPTQGIKPLFLLKEVGFPPVALMWKHLLRAQVTRVKLALSLGGIVVAAVLVRQPWMPVALPSVIGALIPMALVALVFMGGAMTSAPFRQDLNDLDLLKSYPLPTWQVVLGQMLGGLAVSGLLQALFVLAAALCYQPVSDDLELSPAVLVVTTVSILIVMLPFNLVNAFVPSAATLLFPSWTKNPRDTHGGGFEVVGQRMVIGLLQLLATVVAWLPAALVGTGGFFLGQWMGGLPLGIPLAAAFAAIVLLAEGAGGIWVLARILERHDASEEQ